MMIRIFAALVALVAFVPAAFATDIERIQSPGGIEAWLVREDAVPLVSVVAAFKGGARLDPADKTGLLQMTASLLNEGAGDMDAQAFKRRLEDKAIKFGASADADALYITLQTLSENEAEAFDVLRLALAEPRFDAEAVERVRAQFDAYLRRESEDAETAAYREWHKLTLPSHPYGRSENGTPESIAAISQDDIKNAARGALVRGRLLVAIVGDISAEDAAAMLDKVFGALPAGEALPETGEAVLTAAGETKIFERDIPQSAVVFGGPGLLRKDPDYMAATVMNYILGGGGFSSRLMEEVREKRGLAYGVSTYLNPQLLGGFYMGSVGTENARVGESVAIIKQEIARLRDEGPTDKEIADAKTYLTGSFALRLDSNAKIANMLISMQLYDLGIDYLDRRNKEIEAVTRDDIVRAAGRLLDAGKMTFVVVGKPEGLAVQ